MRRPGTDKTHESFAEVAAPDITIRPPRSAQTKREAPFSLRLSIEEKARLKAAAGNMALGAYIKARLFDGLPAVPRQNAPSSYDKQIIGKVLAMLGRSRLSSNMNQIAHAANLGILPLEPELIKGLNAACADIRTMRTCLLRGMGQRGPKLKTKS